MIEDVRDCDILKDSERGIASDGMVKASALISERNNSKTRLRVRRNPLIRLNGVREIPARINEAEEDIKLKPPPVEEGTPPPSRRRSSSLPPKKSATSSSCDKKHQSLEAESFKAPPEDKVNPWSDVMSDVEWQLLRQGSMAVETEPPLEKLFKNHARAKRQSFAATNGSAILSEFEKIKLNKNRRESMPVQTSAINFKPKTDSTVRAIYPLKANHQIDIFQKTQHEA